MLPVRLQSVRVTAAKRTAYGCKAYGLRLQSVRLTAAKRTGYGCKAYGLLLGTQILVEVNLDCAGTGRADGWRVGWRWEACGWQGAGLAQGERWPGARRVSDGRKSGRVRQWYMVGSSMCYGPCISFTFCPFPSLPSPFSSLANTLLRSVLNPKVKEVKEFSGKLHERASAPALAGLEETVCRCRG